MVLAHRKAVAVGHHLGMIRLDLENHLLSRDLLGEGVVKAGENIQEQVDSAMRLLIASVASAKRSKPSEPVKDNVFDKLVCLYTLISHLGHQGNLDALSGHKKIEDYIEEAYDIQLDLYKYF